MPTRPHHTVACAIIERDGRVLVAQRPPGKALALKWEFPGGKLESGESAAAALVREIREELRVDLAVGAALPPVTHDYENATITLLPFLARIAEGAEPHAAEHVALRWCAPAELRGLDWAAADVPVLADYLASRRTRTWRELLGGADAEPGWLASPWLDFAGFVLGLALAWTFAWKTRDLVWTLWLSSLVVGYATIVLGIVSAVRRASTGAGAWVGGVFLLGFFTVHFGMFHFVHSVFLNAFFPVSTAPGMPGPGTYLRVVAAYWPWLLAAAIAERTALWDAWRGPRPGEKLPAADLPKARALGGFNPMRAYVNVVRMHLLIFFFAFASIAKVEHFAVFAVVYAVYFFPWRRVLKRDPFASLTTARR